VDTNPLGTRSHLNSVSPGVKVGGPQTLGDSGVGGATVVVVVAAAAVLAGVPTHWQRKMSTEASARRRRRWGWRERPTAPESLAGFLLGKYRRAHSGTTEGRRMHEDGAEVFEVHVQPVHDVQRENAVGDVDVKVGKRVDEALHLLTLVVDAEVVLNETLKGGINVEGASFTVVEELVFEGQPGVTSRLAALSSDVLQVGGDGVVDPRLDDVVRPIPRRNTDVCGVNQHMVGEGVTREGEQYDVVPSGVVRGGKFQRDRDERMNVLHAGGLDVDIGDDNGLVVIVRWSSATDGGRGGVGEG
jgi:hypothetical protein